MEGTDMILGLESEWAILSAIFILTSVQLVKTILDGVRNKREKVEQRQRMHTMDKIEMYLKILSNKYTEEVTERQLPVLIKECMGHCRESIIVMGSAAITRNDVVNNEREVRAKLKQFINNHFHSATVNLSLFKWKGRLISEFLNQDWCEQTIDGVSEIVINTTRKDKGEAYRQLGSFMDQKFDHYTTETLSAAYEL